TKSNRTEAAWRKPRQSQPEGYRYCASSRLYSSTASGDLERKRLFATVHVSFPPQRFRSSPSLQWEAWQGENATTASGGSRNGRSTTVGPRPKLPSPRISQEI